MTNERLIADLRRMRELPRRLDCATLDATIAQLEALDAVREKARDVVMATTQDDFGRWVIGGDGEELICDLQEAVEAASTHGPAVLEALGETFQARVAPWMQACFGAEISADGLERNDRFVEESLELVQARDYPAERAHALVDYVWGRPKGDPFQEVGGVMVTLAALCLQGGIDMHAAAETELARIWTKVEQIRAKQAAKPTGSALPIAPADQVTLAAGGEDLACYDAGLLGDYGGGNVEWWQDYIRAELGRAHDFYSDQTAALRAQGAELREDVRLSREIASANRVRANETDSALLREIKTLRATLAERDRVIGEMGLLAKAIVEDGHKRLCPGREYTCDCGYDSEIDALAASIRARTIGGE